MTAAPKQGPIQCTLGTDVKENIKHPTAKAIPANIGTYNLASTPRFDLFFLISLVSLAREEQAGLTGRELR